MAHALSVSYHHFANDPRRNNSVPGQFSEWLHGETLVNQGMMLSPWDAPRYLWASVEGAAGLQVLGATPQIEPHLAREWRWLAAVNVPFQGKQIAWLTVRTPELEMFTTSDIATTLPVTRYSLDISSSVWAEDQNVVTLGFCGENSVLLFLGNLQKRTIDTAFTCARPFTGEQRARLFTSILNQWQDLPNFHLDHLQTGIPVVVDASGFVLVEITAR
jgi:hypothetical protein